jgi:hypothetical protein
VLHQGSVLADNQRRIALGVAFSDRLSGFWETSSKDVDRGGGVGPSLCVRAGFVVVF